MPTLESLDMVFDVKESFVVDEAFAGYNVQSFWQKTSFIKKTKKIIIVFFTKFIGSNLSNIRFLKSCQCKIPEKLLLKCLFV